MIQVHKYYKAFKLSRKATINLICFALFVCFAIYFIKQFNVAHSFPIREVSIVGMQHVDHDETQRLLTPLVTKGFFAVNVDQIKESLVQFPWIADAAVQRIWPNRILIEVVEKIPLARWNEGKLLSASGQLFSPALNTFPGDIPQFIGAEGTQLKMMQNYVQLNRALAPLQFKIMRFEMSPLHDSSLILNNGIKLNIGQKDILTRVDDFVKVYQKIIGSRADEVDSIDLRYSNGVAVRWKTGDKRA